jgi:hypothetical protein
MKLMLALLFTLTAFSAFGQGGVYTAAGAVKTQKKEFIPVVNSASSTLSLGQVVCNDLTADDGIAVDFCATSGFPPKCVIAQTSCAVGAQCKCQIKGVHEAVDFDPTQGNAVAGDAAFAHTDGNSYGDRSDTGKQSFGTFLDAASATGTVQVDLNL